MEASSFYNTTVFEEDPFVDGSNGLARRLAALLWISPRGLPRWLREALHALSADLVAALCKKCRISASCWKISMIFAAIFEVKPSFSLCISGKEAMRCIRTKSRKSC